MVALLDERASDEAVIEAAAIAAERDFGTAATDASFVECVRLLAMIPAAAREQEFGRALRELGIAAPDAPDLMTITAAAGAWLDRQGRDLGKPSDLGELARRALVGSLTRLVGDQLPGLFDATAEDTRNAFRRLSQPANFSSLAREFFTRLVSQTLAYWLDRTLSTHVGPGRKFEHVGQRAAFDDALGQYSHEATRIIKESASGWYGKTLYHDGEISRDASLRFGAVALKKTVEELRRKRDVHA